MKKIKLIFTTLAILLLMPSCENDGGDSKINFKNGALVDLQKISTTDSFIDLVAVNSGADINLGFIVDKAIGDFSSMDIVGFYTKEDGTIYKATLVSNVTTFPATFYISKTDLFAAFDELNTASDFELGDRLIITTQLTLKDGSIQRIINDDGSPNYSPNIASSGLYKVLQSYGVSCPSDLGGIYDFVTTNVKAPTGESAVGPLTGTVTFEDQGGGVYTISDASFGGWIGLYGPGNIAEGVTLTDVCNKIAYTDKDQYGEIFTFSNLVINGSEMSFHWENDYGEYGDTTLTRTDDSNWPDLSL